MRPPGRRPGRSGRGSRCSWPTPPTSSAVAGRRDVDRLTAGGYRLTALFSPEHGFQGTEDGPGLPDAVDSATALPIYSLYPGSRPPDYGALDSLDVPLRGLRLRVTDRATYDPTKLAVALLVAIKAAHSDSLAFHAAAFDRLAAGPELREALLAGREAATMWRAWEPALARFRNTRAKYLLY